MQSLDLRESEHFQRAKAEYIEMLQQADPIPSDSLTVDKINSLQSQNKKLVSFILSFYALIQNDNNNVGSTSEMKEVSARYLKYIEDFAETFWES